MDKGITIYSWPLSITWQDKIQVYNLFNHHLKTDTKELTSVAMSLLAVLLNIVLQNLYGFNREPRSLIDQGYFIFLLHGSPSDNHFKVGGLSSIRIMLAAVIFLMQLLFTWFFYSCQKKRCQAK